MMKIVALSSSLLALAIASPVKRADVPHLADFDTIDGVPLLSATAIDSYDDIYWNGMSLVKTLNLGFEPGSALLSPPNCAAYSALDVVTIQQGQPAMLADFEGSPTDTFDLESFYFGCVAGSEESVTSVPLACTVTVRGYSDDAGADLVGEVDFAFIPIGSRPPMMLAPVGLTGLKRAEFFVSNDASTAALIDSVSYSTNPYLV